MISSSQRSWVSLILLANYLLTAGMCGVPVVLCIGEDGHVALESISTECTASKNDNSGVRLEHSDCKEICGVECTDIPLFPGQSLIVSSQAGINAHMKLLPIAFVVAMAASKSCQGRPFSTLEPCSGRSSVLGAIHTVVLLV